MDITPSYHLTVHVKMQDVGVLGCPKTAPASDILTDPPGSQSCEGSLSRDPNTPSSRIPIKCRIRKC